MRLLSLLVGCLLVAALLPLGAARANVIGIERYMGHAQLAYSGDFTLQGDRGTIRGTVQRGPDRQRTDFSLNGVALSALADFASGEGTLWSTVYGAFATTPLERPGVRDWVPQLQHHSQVAIVAVEGEAGLEQVNGVTARRHSLAGISPEGTGYSGQLWVTETGVIVRLTVRLAGQPQPIVYQLENLHMGLPPDSAFVVPSGLQQRPWSDVVALLGG